MDFAIVAAQNSHVAAGNGLVEPGLLFGWKRGDKIIYFPNLTPAAHDEANTLYDKETWNEQKDETKGDELPLPHRSACQHQNQNHHERNPTKDDNDPTADSAKQPICRLVHFWFPFFESFCVPCGLIPPLSREGWAEDYSCKWFHGVTLSIAKAEDYTIVIRETESEGQTPLVGWKWWGVIILQSSVLWKLSDILWSSIIITMQLYHFNS